MKIFNWVQRRFHHGALKDHGLAQNVKKAESITNDAEKLALLKQVALADVLDGWRDGILTIGTLGFDALKPFNQQNEYFILDTEDDDEEGREGEEGQTEEEKEGELEEDHSTVYGDDDSAGEEEVNPLIFTTFGHMFDIDEGKTDVIMTVDDHAPVVKDIHSSSLEIDERKKKGERITLAELFMADSDIKKKPHPVETEPDHSIKKSVVRSKNGLSFAKKLLPQVKEDSRPIKKFHKLMRRMLKRKIHPEVESKVCQADSDQNNPGITGNEAVESVSLLQSTPPGRTI